MRNLRTVSVGNIQADLSSDPGHEVLVATYDASREQVLFATSSSTLHCIPLALQQGQWALSLLGSQSIDDRIVEGNIVGMEFMMEQEALVVGFKAGDLLSVFLSSHDVEVVGKVEGGIIQMSSSPDGELLAVATSLGQLLLMTQDWEVLYEISLDQHHNDQVRSTNEAIDYVHISWRGDGKYFAILEGGFGYTVRYQLRIWERDTGALHACSEKFAFMGMALDWIPSGAKIASACCRSSIQKPPGIVFFERNGLERGSFDIEGPLEAKVEMIKWNCSSDLLAVMLRCDNWDAVQIWSCSNYHWYLKQEWQYPKRDQVRFFWDPEKPMCLVVWNLFGLLQVVRLCWDSAITNESVALVIDGSCLLVTPLTLVLIPPPMYLFKMRFQSPIQTVAFTELNPDRMVIAAGLSDGALGLVALPSIDTWDEFEGRDYVIANVEVHGTELNFGRLRLLSWKGSNVLLGVLDHDESLLSLHSNPDYENSCPQDSWNVVAASQGILKFYDSIVEIEVESGGIDLVDGVGNLSSSGWIAKMVRRTLINQAVMAIIASPLEKGRMLVHVGNGWVFPYNYKEGLVSAWGETSNDQASLSLATPRAGKKMLSPCLWVRAVAVGCPESEVLIALDEQGRLQVESHLVCSDCTSFTLHFAGKTQRKTVHVVYTTKQDKLHVINFDDILGQCSEKLRIAHDISHLSSMGNSDQGLETRNMLKIRPLWERSARLITALGGRDVAIILQTVRGNLETNYPRNLVLASIATALSEWNFKDAVALARQHHINLNVIVDYRGWKTFAGMACEFVKQVKNLTHITELICAVNNESVMDGVYKNLISPYAKELEVVNTASSTGDVASCNLLELSKLESNSSNQGNKVQLVMKALRVALEKEVEESSMREMCILTTLARSDPPELEEALKRIKILREEEIQSLMGEDVNPSNQSSKRLSAEEALKHLLWLSDSKSVFNAALGLYDLHLAAMVASNSQHDPKEFLPFLQELGEMPASMMRYTIDLKLGKLESALYNIAAAGESYFNICLQLMKSNPGLFNLGNRIFKENPQRMAVLEAWGDHLLNEKRFDDAAAAFHCCSQLQKAMGAYHAGGNWQGVLVVAGMLGLSNKDVRKQAEDLSEELQALGRPGEAAKINLEYCKDVEGAIRLFIEAREWIEAVRVAFSHNKGEQVKTQVEPAALECATAQVSELQEGLEKVGKYLARYLAVRQRRLLLAAKLKMETAGDVEDDALSDVSSNISGMSVYTTSGTSASNMSLAPSTVESGGQNAQLRSQGRRKSQGKRIRAGSSGEEAVLLAHLRSLALTSGTLEELKKLLHVLVLVGHGSTAEKLQHLALRYQSFHSNAVRQAEEKIAEEATDKVTETKTGNAELQWWWEVLDAPAMSDQGRLGS